MTAASITTIVAACASLEGLACVSADTALRCWARVSNSFDSHLQSSNDRGQRDKTKPSLSLATVSHSFKKPLSTGYTMWCITTTKKKKTASGFCPALPLASSHYTAAIHATSPIRLFASPASLSLSLSFPPHSRHRNHRLPNRPLEPAPARKAKAKPKRPSLCDLGSTLFFSSSSSSLLLLLCALLYRPTPLSSFQCRALSQSPALGPIRLPAEPSTRGKQEEQAEEEEEEEY